MVDYANVPPTIATCLSARMATLHELDTVYGSLDLWDMLEVHAVDSHNRGVASQHQEGAV